MLKSGESGSHGSQSFSSSSSVNIVKKKNTKSPVWSHFGLKANESGCEREDVDRPVCRKCGKIVPAKGSNTSNLYWHLKEHHPTLYAEIGIVILDHLNKLCCICASEINVNNPRQLL